MMLCTWSGYDNSIVEVMRLDYIEQFWSGTDFFYFKFLCDNEA